MRVNQMESCFWVGHLRHRTARYKYRKRTQYADNAPPIHPVEPPQQSCSATTVSRGGDAPIDGRLCCRLPQRPQRRGGDEATPTGKKRVLGIHQCALERVQHGVYTVSEIVVHWNRSILSCVEMGNINRSMRHIEG